MKITHDNAEFSTQDIDEIDWLCPGEGCKVALKTGESYHLTGAAYDQIRGAFGIPPVEAPLSPDELYKHLIG